MIDAVYEGEERVTFSPFVAPCCVEGMALGVGVSLWGEVKGNNRIFSSVGEEEEEEEENVFLDNVFAEVKVNGNAPFVFVSGKVCVSRPFSSFWERGRNPAAFFGGMVRFPSVFFSCPVGIHFALVLSCDL